MENDIMVNYNKENTNSVKENSIKDSKENGQNESSHNENDQGWKEQIEKEQIEKEELLEECATFFRENPGFNRVFEKMKKKYKSLGKTGGRILITNLRLLEKKALSGFFRRDYTRQKQAAISLQKFEDALQETRYAGLTLENLLKKYFAEEEILSYKEERKLYLRKRDRYFTDIINKFGGTRASNWLNEVLENRNNAYSLFMKRYNLDSEKLKKDIYRAAGALNALPVFTQETKRLAVFAAQITKDPHAFDQGTDLDTLLQYAISYILNAEKPGNAEDRAELYYNAGILVNEVMNHTLCFGLNAYLDNRIHQGWHNFWLRGEPLLVSLKNLSIIDRVVSPTGKVFVFENPAVFTTILDKLTSIDMSNSLDAQTIAISPLICTGGQLKLASLVLLDLLAKEGTTIYYSGDFDPEGLGIADKLKDRYGEQLRLWRYSKADYEKTLSRNKISGRSMSKLNNLQDRQLIELGKWIRKYTVAGYQEMLIDDLLDDIEGQ